MSSRWKKGSKGGNYKEFLLELKVHDKEHGTNLYLEHLEVRARIKAEKQVQKSFKEERISLMRSQTDEWLSLAHNACYVQLLKGIQGDTQAFRAAMEYLEGPLNAKLEDEGSMEDMVEAIIALVGKLPD